MAEETNGNHDGRSRLDRIEAAMEMFARDHEEFRAEHKLLLRAQVVQQGRMDALTVKLEEVTDKLDGLIGAVEEMGQQQAETNRSLASAIQKVSDDTDRRLRRLEGDPAA